MTARGSFRNIARRSPQGGVDRKILSIFAEYLPVVALRWEAWIKLFKQVDGGGTVGVALRKESVDKEWGVVSNSSAMVASLSARRAWIEIAASACALSANGAVALRKEEAWIKCFRRPPRVALRKGGMGATAVGAYESARSVDKRLPVLESRTYGRCVALHKGGVDKIGCKNRKCTIGRRG